MLLLALIVFGVTAWFMGLRTGGIAAGISFATLIAAQVVPGTALVIYGLHIVWLVGLVYAGPRVSRLLKKPDPEAQGLGAEARRWFRRGKALGEALWRSRSGGSK